MHFQSSSIDEERLNVCEARWTGIVDPHGSIGFRAKVIGQDVIWEERSSASLSVIASEMMTEGTEMHELMCE